jgi:signal transduction histidine kinase/CheY-like chemotaxis protein
VSASGSLRGKLIGVMLLTALVAVLVAISAMLAYDLHAYHRGWVDDVSTQAEMLGRHSAPALAFDDARVARENLAVLRFQPKIRAAAIYSARGAVFATYVADGEPADAAIPPMPSLEAAVVEDGSLLVFRPIVENRDVVGTVYLRADYELYDRLLGYAGIALVATLVALLVAWVMTSWLRRIVLRPILDVGDAARDVIAREDYSRRVDQRRDDELGALVAAFNEMMGEIERRTETLAATNREKEREVDERRRAQDEVMRLNLALEQRVRDRTAALEQSNRELALATGEAERANQAKSDFLSSMSHELRTPLNAIIGFGQVLGADEGGLPADRRKAFLGHIVAAGQHLLTLINDILNLAQIEAGKVVLSPEPVGMAELLDECRILTDPLTAARGIRLLFPLSLDVVAHADRTRLKQVLLNLLSNAVKYNREQGSVAVECVYVASERLRVTVRDTGLGMRPDQLQSLFQPFNRLGQEHGKQQGTGIGLVVTKHLVELMGGTLGVSSTVGAGTEFCVDLPALPPVAAQAGSPPAAGEVPSVSGGPAATVLCVDDNPASLELVRALLAARPGVHLLSAENGQVGVEMARAHHPDVILMDNNMPVLSGALAQARLRDDPSTAHIPVIAVSANAMPDAVKQGLAAGFFRYLTKPLDPKALAEALDSALQQKRAGDP